MGGFFGTIKKESCVTDLFYGVDYNSHLGTKRAGIVTYENGVFKRAIHNIENSYFRSKFEAELPEFSGNSGIGVISDTDAQPIIISCHLGKFAIVTVAKINNVEELEKELLASGNHFSEHSNNIINQSELVSMIISQGKAYVDGIRLVQEKIKGSCSMPMVMNRSTSPVKKCRYAPSYGYITDIPPANTKGRMSKRCAFTLASKWVKKTTSKPISSPASPIPVWAWLSDMP